MGGVKPESHGGSKGVAMTFIPLACPWISQCHYVPGRWTCLWEQLAGGRDLQPWREQTQDRTHW